MDYPTEEGTKTIGENEHTFIAWEKAYIVFPPGTAPENLYSPVHLGRRRLLDLPLLTNLLEEVQLLSHHLKEVHCSTSQHHQEPSHQLRKHVRSIQADDII